jgi:fermentation-respiration switch protein FrsA (DUF1100 family)
MLRNGFVFVLERSLLLASIPAICAIAGCMNPFERFIFFPDSHMVGTPAGVGLRHEEIEFEAADGVKLHGWFVPGERPETLLWFHGNAGNISHRLDNLRLLHDLVGANVFLFDYRQYGRSEGTATESGLYADARGALAHLRVRADVDRDRLVYFGRSLGSAVAVDLAVTDPPQGLILETPFFSLREMAQTILPGSIGRLVPQAFDNGGKIDRVRVPLLFIHGDRDDIVPYEQGRRLFESAAKPKAFYTIRGATHNDTYVVGGVTYFRRIREFIDGLAS